ncbi:putative carboxylesterase [Helianthus debilis subsp. tardiflorus]
MKTRIELPVYSTATHAAKRKDDVDVNPTRKLWFCIFVPMQHAVEDLPVIIYFNGGGFVFLSANEKHFDTMCRRMCLWLLFQLIALLHQSTATLCNMMIYCFDVLKFLDDEENWSKSLPKNANISRVSI